MVMGLAALKCILEKDSKTAISMCKDAIRQLEGSNVLSRPLISELITFISEHKTTSFRIPNVSDVEFKPGSFQIFESQNSTEDLPNLKLRNIGDWLVTDKYEKVLFITTFVPLISPSTPWIDTIELERAQMRMKNGSVSEGNNQLSPRKVRTILRKGNARTESTPRPRIQKSTERSYAPSRKFSQEVKITDRSNTSNGESRHIMFEFSTLTSKNSGTLPIDLVPLQPRAPSGVLHRTLINFKKS